MATNDVKAGVVEDDKVENVMNTTPSTENEIEATAGATEIDEKEARRILSKVDYRLVPILSLLYLVAFVDRSNSRSSTQAKPNLPKWVNFRIES
jgi:hypothetical protein